MTFKDAKAPNGWGPAEVADVRAWIRRLEEEAGQRRAEALAAMAKEEDWKVRPELESKASPAKEEANEAE